MLSLYMDLPSPGPVFRSHLDLTCIGNVCLILIPQIATVMDKFERQFEDLDVHTQASVFLPVMSLGLSRKIFGTM